MSTFATERLLVEQWGADLADQGRYRQLCGDLERILTPRVLNFLPQPLHVGTRENSIENWISKRDVEADMYTVRRANDRQLVGLLLLAEITDADGSATIHLGYLFAENAWGKGYATELLRGLIPWLGRHGEAKALFAGVQKGHDASVRVLQKTGFRKVHRAPDGETDMFTLRIP